MALPLFDLIRSKKVPELKLKITKSDIYIFVAILIFFVSLFIYANGSFKYPWLEDSDPWHHASGIKYVSIEKDVFNTGDDFMYINPYPPGYDLFFGVLHQTSVSLYWTMKFFNALIISLGILFFYFFAKKIIRHRGKALFATFILASIPSYLSHFIWAHSLVITLLFVALYCVEMYFEDKKWGIASIIVIASIVLSQPTQPIKFAVIFGAYFLVKWISTKKFDWKLLGSLFLGYILSIIWWADKWKGMLGKGAGYGVEKHAHLYTGKSFFGRILTVLQEGFAPYTGTATRPYSFQELFFAQHQNMINNPIGIGLVISLLLAVSLIYILVNYKKLLSKEKNYLLIILFWAVFCFIGLNSLTFNLPFGFFGFRFWMLLAPAIAILSAEALWFLFSIGKKYSVPAVFIILIVVLGVILTSAHQKYSVNTAQWPPGQAWKTGEELGAYVWMKDNLEINTPVFAYVNNNFVLGFDMYSCIWCSDVKEFQKTAMNVSAENTHNRLKSLGYSYVVIGARDVENFGVNATNDKVAELLGSGLFRQAYGNAGAVVLQLA
jgi:hypothetical protein